MLNDGIDSIVQKIKKAKTDPLPLPTTLQEAKKRPEALNLLTIFAALNETNVQEVITNYAGREFSLFKKDLSAPLRPASLWNSLNDLDMLFNSINII